MLRLILSLSFLLLAAAVSSASPTLSFTIDAGKHDRVNEPVCVPVNPPPGVSEKSRVAIRDKDKLVAVGQVCPASLVTEQISKATHELNFILPSLKAGKSLSLTASFSDGKQADAGPSFRWVEKDKEPWSELRLGDRPVLRYEYAPLDESSAKARTETFKVYHHVYDPSGKRLVTKGPGGLYTHHRGLFYGFRLVSYDGHTVDIWHCPDGASKSKNEAHQAHKRFLSRSAGPVLGRHRVEIAWNGLGKKTFAIEQRELTAYNVPGGILIEFASLLKPTGGPVKLDGDPQHAGFHFRADNEVDSKRKQTIFIRPSGVDKPGVERNWPADKKQADLPWLAMSFVLGDKRYTAAYLDKPTNPKEARFSERTYGRFGSYFVKTVTKEKPLLVDYRIWLQEGQMTPEQVAALDRAFVAPAAVKVKE
jgi:hypothetical protein